MRRGDDTQLPPSRALNDGTAITVSGTPPGSTSAQSAAQRLDDARRLLDPQDTGKVTEREVGCIATRVVDNPPLYDIASNMAVIRNKDLQQVVINTYLGCAYEFVLGQYMVFAPRSLTTEQRACIEATYRRLDPQLFAEVIVIDPDAGQTGPVVIGKCTGAGGPDDPFAGITVPVTAGDRQPVGSVPVTR